MDDDEKAQCVAHTGGREEPQLPRRDLELPALTAELNAGCGCLVCAEGGRLVVAVGPDGRVVADDRLDPDGVGLSVHASAVAIVLRIASSSLLPSCTVSACQP